LEEHFRQLVGIAPLQGYRLKRESDARFNNTDGIELEQFEKPVIVMEDLAYV